MLPAGRVPVWALLLWLIQPRHQLFRLILANACLPSFQNITGAPFARLVATACILKPMTPEVGTIQKSWQCTVCLHFSIWIAHQSSRSLICSVLSENTTIRAHCYSIVKSFHPFKFSITAFGSMLYGSIAFSELVSPVRCAPGLPVHG